ncbi:MAG: hypothetical protein KDK23_09365 [Leptospiraceae bacterium]|nr:hypothetical protein [Leptospiraceae bacterium]
MPLAALVIAVIGLAILASEIAIRASAIVVGTPVIPGPFHSADGNAR